MNNEYQFVSTDSASLIASLTTSYEKLTGRTLQPSDPDKLFLSWVADVIIHERVSQNYIGNQNIPSRAEGENLDALGEFIYSVKRLAAQSAKCTMRFNISEAQTVDILVPVGTRVTDTSRSLVWATTNDEYVPAGETSVDVMVQCETEGEVGNGYATGQINTLIDIDDILYFSSCENIDVSAGGSEEASDKEYYEMMRQGLDAFSVAGPMGAYIYWAKSVSTSIADVRVIRPKHTRSGTLPIYSREDERVGFIGGDHIKVNSLTVYAEGDTTPATRGTDYTVDYSEGLLKIALTSEGALSAADKIKFTVDQEKAGYVYIYALMDNGTIAGETIKSAIYAACNDDSVRPLTDYVSVEDPEIINYDIRIKYFIPSDTELSSADIANAVNNAVDEYVAWQCQRLGRDINPSYLNYLLMKTGIKRVEIESPVFTKVRDGSDNAVPQVALMSNTEIVNGGYENE